MQQIQGVLRNYKSLVPAFACLILVLFAFGCSKKSEIVGSWQNLNVQEIVEFKPDKSGIIQVKNMPPLKFVWKENTSHSYLLDVDLNSQKKSLKGIVQNDVLVLESEIGKETYRKLSSK